MNINISKKYIVVISFIMSLLLVLSLTGCGDKTAETDKTYTQAEVTSDKNTSETTIGETSTKAETESSAETDKDTGTNAEVTSEKNTGETTTGETVTKAETESSAETDKDTGTNAEKQNITIYPVIVDDAKGNRITIEKEPATILSMGPNITESIYSLGLMDRLVGRTDYCDYPEEVNSITSVGSITEPNVEAIADLKPDVVIASTHFKEEIGKKLEGLGIKVLVLYSAQSFEGVYKMIQDMGLVLNVQDKAEEVVAGMTERVQDVKEKVDGLKKPSVYYVIGYGSGDYTAGRDTFIGQMIEMAGAKNAADDVEGWAYSLEKLAEKDPDILICSRYFGSKAGIQSANGYKDLTAVINGKLYEIDNNMLDRQGPRLAQGLEELARIIHPEAFK